MTKKVAIDIVARDKTKQAIDSSNKGLARLKKSVFSLKTAFVSLGAGIILRGFVQAGIQIQNLEVQLKSLTGSAVAGRKVLNEVTQFAATTPFELADIQRGVTSLITVKERAEQAGVSFKDLLTIAGNTAVILGGDFELASLQLQRSFSAGIASADTFRDRGVTAMAGFQAGVRTSVSESIKGLNEAFGSGGKFGTIMNDLANTVQGNVSNIQDIFFLFQASVAEGLKLGTRPRLPRRINDLGVAGHRAVSRRDAITLFNARLLAHIGTGAKDVTARLGHGCCRQQHQCGSSKQGGT